MKKKLLILLSCIFCFCLSFSLFNIFSANAEESSEPKFESLGYNLKFHKTTEDLETFDDVSIQFVLTLTNEQYAKVLDDTNKIVFNRQVYNGYYLKVSQGYLDGLDFVSVRDVYYHLYDSNYSKVELYTSITNGIRLSFPVDVFNTSEEYTYSFSLCRLDYNINYGFLWLWKTYDFFFNIEETAKYKDVYTFSIEDCAQHYLDSWTDDENSYKNQVKASLVEKGWDDLVIASTMNNVELILQDLAGISTLTEMTEISVYWDEINSTTISGNAVFDVKQKHATIQVKSLYAKTESIIEQEMLNQLDKRSIADFNCVWKNQGLVNGEVVNYGDKIIKQAVGFDYDYEVWNLGQFSFPYPTLTITYADYLYKDFFILVKDNDLLDNFNCEIPIYTTSVVSNSETTSLIFDFAMIERVCKNNYNLLFSLTKENFNFYNVPDGIFYEFEESNGVANSLVITFDNSLESDLFYLNIQVVAEIIPDFIVDVNINAKALSFDDGINVSDIALSVPGKYYSEIVGSIAYWDNFYSEKYYKTFIDENLSLNELNGQCYYKPVGINYVVVENGDSVISIDFTVEYLTYTLVEFRDINNKVISYKNFDTPHLEVKLSACDIPLQDGYRISNLTSKANDCIVSFDMKNPSESVLTLNGDKYAGTINTVVVEYSDSWPINIHYLSRYGNTPFAQSKVSSEKINVNDYDINNLTKQDVYEIMGVKTLNVLKSAVLDKIRVEVNESTIDVHVLYTFAIHYTLDVNGNKEEMKIPLTSYADWLNGFGYDWSIMYLNTPEHKYFNYVNDVEPSELYGYFSMAVFKEKQVDLNHLFRQEKDGGCQVIHQYSELRGSAFYQGISNLRLVFALAGGTIGGIFGHPISGALLGTALNYGIVSWCETINPDNGIYYTYFFYLDGDVKNQSYLSTGGADDCFDIDSSLVNFWQDTGDFLESQSNSGWLLAIKIILGIILGCFGLYYLILGIKKIIKVLKE